MRDRKRSTYTHRRLAHPSACEREAERPCLLGGPVTPTNPDCARCLFVAECARIPVRRRRNAGEFRYREAECWRIPLRCAIQANSLGQESP
jgi:hypothetical protein